MSDSLTLVTLYLSYLPQNTTKPYSAKLKRCFKLQANITEIFLYMNHSDSSFIQLYLLCLADLFSPFYTTSNPSSINSYFFLTFAFLYSDPFHAQVETNKQPHIVTSSPASIENRDTLKALPLVQYIILITP